ncbi:hypothetical protein DYB35_006568 [Aphanomyces astaci]|uniref:Uncharacterized protein n=1 Tax=Aphanomyces astaci TaxID=112090 RepID=A0A418D860_APHAT|nr:hypothetical protein DYB35_006568 [Aphanomyces astaci]
MVLLIALHVVYVALLVLLRSFVMTSPLVFTFVFEAVLVAVFGLVYVMAYTTSTDSKQTYANRGADAMDTNSLHSGSDVYATFDTPANTVKLVVTDSLEFLVE